VSAIFSLGNILDSVNLLHGAPHHMIAEKYRYAQ